MRPDPYSGTDRTEAGGFDYDHHLDQLKFAVHRFVYAART